MSLIDLFKDFHRDAIQQEFPPSARVLFDTLLYKFNESFWTDELVLSERDLSYLTGLSPATLHRAKHFLASRHIIKINSFKNKTAYSLGEATVKQSWSSNEAVMKQSRSSSEAVAEQSSRLITHSIKDSSQDVKTLDVKTLSSLSSSRARDSLEDIDTLVDEWQESRFGKLDFELISRLDVWLKKYGLAEMLAAMAEAKEANGNSNGVSFKFFASVLERRNKPKKGVKESGRTAELRYDEPDADTVYPWDKSGYASDSGAKQGTS